VNDYGDSKGNLVAWIAKEETTMFIRRKFGTFLRTFTDENNVNVYEQRIQDMCQNNKMSIQVNYVHISHK